MDKGDNSDSEDPIRDMGSGTRKSVPAHVIEDRHLDRWQHHAMYVGLRLPSRGKRHRRRRHHHHNRAIKREHEQAHQEQAAPPTPPGKRVQFILGSPEGEDEDHQMHDIFCEMDELRAVGDSGEMEWKEMARWVKFEEDVEEGGDRWSKPHVATLSLHSLFELRKGILSGTVMLDMDAKSLEEIVDLMLEKMIASNHLGENERERVQKILLKPHHHQFQKGLHKMRSLADIGKKFSSKHLTDEEKGSNKNLSDEKKEGNHHHHHHHHLPHLPSKHSFAKFKLGTSTKDVLENGSAGDLNRSSSTHKFNEHFLKKLPPGSEAANILVGEASFLSQPIIAFIRLRHSLVLGELTEVHVPTRFIFVMLGPDGQTNQYHEIGRSIATLMSDEIFHHVAYKAKSCEDLLSGIDEFLDNVTVLPPGEWDPNIRIEPPKSVPSQASRTNLGTLGAPGPGGSATPNGTPKVEEPVEESHSDPTLMRTGRIFGGLIQDIKRKAPFYLSDFRDGLHIQCLSSFIFVYFACLSPIVTFGGLLGSATNNNMAAIESLLAGAFCGISYHLFAGQPLTILGSTGPVLVFETIVFNFAADQGFDYLAFRFWIGIWCALILFIIVVFDLSALVRYITRFTEESFALLIALIYIYEAFKKLLHIKDEYPTLTFDEIKAFNESCFCQETNSTAEVLANQNLTAPMNFFNLSEVDCHFYKGELMGSACHIHPYPNVYYFSWILFIFTFVIAYSGKGFKDTRFLPSKIRSVLSDFAVTLAILIMCLADYFVGLPTPKLNVPGEFAPTSPSRGWIVDPFTNPGWTIPAAFGFALLCSILIFMDQQITAVIVNRKEHKLKKGSGYHLDLLLIAIQMAVCSLLGLPWFVAATVLSINHVHSLTLESKTAAPGERPRFLGIREQRVTGIAVFLFVGLSVLFTDVLKFIPMPVLYGVFLYMGVSSIKGIELCQRIACVFMPPKYQPDYMFLRHVPLRRVYFFTFIQVVCLALLWTIKAIKAVSIVFPLMVLAMCFIRKALDWVFTRHELKWLDDVMPESHKREKEKKKKKHDGDDLEGVDNKGMIMDEKEAADTEGVSMPHVALWKQLVAEDQNANQHDDSGVRQRKPGTNEDDNRNKTVNFDIGPPGYDDVHVVVQPTDIPKNISKVK